MTQSAQIPDPRIIWPKGCAPAGSSVFAQNIIEIAATPNTAWSLLIDCVKWPSWYKHCADVSVLRGGPVLSADSKFRFKTIGFYFEPEIETFQPSRMLVWSAKGPAGTSGAHCLAYRANAGRLSRDNRRSPAGPPPASCGGPDAPHAPHVAR